MTALLCGTTDRFKAGVAQRGLYDWATGVLASDFGHEMVRYFGGVWPWVDPGRYLAESPIRHADSIRAPLLVIHNEGDLRTGPSQAFELFVALKSRGARTAMVLIPEESHGLSRGGRIDRRLERLRQIRGWFEAWL